jgi:hypothetical protein
LLKEEEMFNEYFIFKFILIVKSLNNPFYNYSSSSPFYKIPIILITLNISRNKWLYNINTFKYIINNLLQFDIYKEYKDLLVIYIVNNLIYPLDIKIISLNYLKSNNTNIILKLYNVLYIYYNLP